MRLQRERLELSPVYSTAVTHDGHHLGYIRLVNFSQHAAADMQRAVANLQVRTDGSPLTHCSCGAAEQLCAQMPVRVLHGAAHVCTTAHPMRVVTQQCECLSHSRC